MENRAVQVDRLNESSHAQSAYGATGDRVSTASPGRSTLLDDPLGPLRNVMRRWRLVLSIVVLGSILGWLSGVVAVEADTTPIAVDHYQARHVLVLDTNVPATQAILSVRNLNVLAKRITIGEVPAAVAESLGISTTDASTRIRVLIRSDSESLDLVAIGATPLEAEAIADAYATELLSFLETEADTFATDAEASAQNRLDEAEANLSAARQALQVAVEAEDERQIALLEQDQQQFLSARIVANAALLEIRADGVPIVPIESLQLADGNATVIAQSRFNELIDNASIGQNIEVLFGDESESDSNTGALSAVSNRLPNGMASRVAAGAGLGLLFGVLVALVLNRLDNRVRSKRQVEALLDLPVIAEVPALGRAERNAVEMHARENPRSRFAEQYRALASTLMYARRSRRSRGQVVLVTSPGPAEGKTTTVANLGAMLAEAGESVLLVNCDFRRPRLHLLTGSEYEPMDLNKTDIPQVELISNVAASTDALPTEVIAAQRSVIKKAMRAYDLILIDTAPLLATNDAVDLLDLVDDVVLVMRAGKTTMQAADRAAETLDRRRAHVLGVAITDVDARHSADYYYYGGYYDEAPSNAKRRFERFRRNADIDLVDNNGAETDSVDLTMAESGTDRR